MQDIATYHLKFVAQITQPRIAPRLHKPEYCCNIVNGLSNLLEQVNKVHLVIYQFAILFSLLINETINEKSSSILILWQNEKKAGRYWF